MSALRTAIANPGIKRLLLGWLTAWLGTWAFTIVIALYAYDVGGADAVGLAVLVRMLPTALVAPSTALLADRHPRRTVLVVSSAVRAVLMAVIGAAALAGVPFGVVLALSAVFTAANTAHKPAQAALMPQLATTPAELAAGNVAWSGIDYAAFLVGSLLAGIVAATVGLDVGLLVCALPFVVAVAVLRGLPADERPDPLELEEANGALSESLEGFRTVWRDREQRLLAGLFAANMVTQAMVDLLLVVAAIELLDMGEAGAGWLSAAWGVGGLVGGLVAVSLLGRGRLASGLALGMIAAGLPLIVVALLHEAATALVLLGALGVGYSLIEIALLTLTQRLAADDVLARVFGVQETLFVVGTAVGAAIAAALVERVGAEEAIVVTGLCLPVLALVMWRRLSLLEAGAPVPARAYVLLRGLDMFACLPVATIETLAVRSESLAQPAGVELITQGDEGDRFYVVDSGTLEVEIDGTILAERTTGECIGEIALLHQRPRMATVRASTAVSLVALDRADFLSGVGSHVRSSRAAEALAREREATAS
jgi:MFS family permease